MWPHKGFIFKPSLVRKITYVIHKHKKINTVVNPHEHHKYGHEFIYVDYGRIHLLIEGQLLTVNCGECVFIAGGKKHSFESEDGTHFEFLNIMFRGSVPEILFGKAISVSRSSAELMKRMKEENIQQKPYFENMIACDMTELIISLFRQETMSLPNRILDTECGSSYQSEAVNKALAVITANYAVPLTLKHLSKSVNVSIPHLRTLLKKETGDNFITMLHKHRIAAAKHLIKDELPIQQIITAVGYSSSSFFFKIFKRLTGMTPKDYLNSLGEPTENS